MPLPATIDRNRTELARIVAGLFALLGLTDGSAPGRIARHVHRAIALTLRPAEFAVRRLIVFLAGSMKAKALPARAMPQGFVRGGRGKSGLAFQLFDPRPRIFRRQRQRQPVATTRAQPRISFFGDGEARRISLAPARPPSGDGLENAAHLVRRLQALKAALDNLPRQARRLVRALARRQKFPRLKFRGPLRPGRAPGWRRRPLAEIDKILRQSDRLARKSLPPDTS